MVKIRAALPMIAFCFLLYGAVLYLHHQYPRFMDDGAMWYFLIGITAVGMLMIVIGFHFDD